MDYIAPVTPRDTLKYKIAQQSIDKLRRNIAKETKFTEDWLKNNKVTKVVQDMSNKCEPYTGKEISTGYPLYNMMDRKTAEYDLISGEIQ